ncbi:MAG: NAD-dependent epimerase/dehydratase family protein [Halobacteriales archaeon]|nr:NAD-dependent epimerase/dehydratase family protein [Halobacteriales archaeon]
MTDETVLITGGTGFIGPYVAELLLERGHQPVLYDIAADRTVLSKLDIADDVTLVTGDVADQTAIDRAVHHHDVTRIIHLAVMRDPPSNPRRAVEVNMGGATTVLEAARTFETIDRVAVASTEEVYAPLSAYGTETAAETALVDPQSIYAAAKLYNERQVDVYTEEYGVDAIALRPTGVYGPYRQSDESGVFRRLFEQPAVGSDIAVENGDLLVSWLYVRDAARAFVDAVFAPDDRLSQRVYNIPGDAATVGDMASVIESILEDVTITVTDGGGEWSAQALDPSAAQADYGYEIEYGRHRGAKEYINTIRTDNGLSPVTASE